MKKIILFVLVVICFDSYSQKTEVIEKKDEGYTEVFTRLKKKPYSKHGDYKLYRTSDNMLLQEGAYEMGKITGVWNYYGWKGEVYKKYDYAEGKIIFYNPEADSTTSIIRTNGELQRVKLDWPVEYLGGEQAMHKALVKNIVYPELAKEQGMMGTVYIGFYISTTGVASGHHVVTSAGDLLDQESLRGVKLIPDNWLPAKYKGEAVEVFYIMPVNYRIV